MTDKAREDAEAWDDFRREFYAPTHWGESYECRREQIEDMWEEREAEGWNHVRTPEALWESLGGDFERPLTEQDAWFHIGAVCRAWLGRQ